MYTLLNILSEAIEPKYGLIAQTEKDNRNSGDTLQREGMLAIATHILYKLNKIDIDEYYYLKTRYNEKLLILNDPNHPGLLRRYPDLNIWQGQSDRLSRDQCIPNVIGMGFINKEKLVKFKNAHLKHSFCLWFTNTVPNHAEPPGHPDFDRQLYKKKIPDIITPAFFGAYIRAYNNIGFFKKALLNFLDLDLLINSSIKTHVLGKNPNESDDVNHLCYLYQSELVSPTLISKIAMWYYFKNRPYPRVPNPNIVPNPTNVAQATMNLYFREKDQGPKLEIVYKDINSFMWDTFSWKLKNKF